MLKKTMYAVVSAAALCAAALTAEAKAAAPKAPPANAAVTTEAQAPAKTPARAVPFYGKIGAVDKANKTFTIEGKKSTRTFTTTATTKIEKMGMGASWDDFKTGEYVHGSAMKKAEGQYEAVSVKLGQKEKTASAVQPESKPKKQ